MSLRRLGVSAKLPVSRITREKMPLVLGRERIGWWRPSVPAVVTVVAVGGCSGAGEAPVPDWSDSGEYRTQIESWREQRDASLRKPEGWLTLAGLYWLEDGDNSFGSDPANALVFPEGMIDAVAGVLIRDGREVTLLPAAGVALTSAGAPISGATPLALDTSQDGPTVIDSGSLTFYAIERGDMIGVRLKDRESSVLAEFEGMEYFPIDETWRLTGRYVLFDEPRVLRTPNVLGTVTEEEIYGEIRFEIGGEMRSLRSSGDPAEGFFVVFGDRTNGSETYSGGRFVHTEPVQADGTVVIDFNKSYCPPCVFTPYATCPLPPLENKLSLRVEAGEKMFGVRH